MKKKIAVLLAAIISISPTKIFGAGVTSLDRSPTTVPEKTLFAETYTNNTVNKVDRTRDDDEVKNIVSAPVLTVDLKNDIKKGDRFTLTLENSHWYFRNATGFKLTPLTGDRTGLPVMGMPEANASTLKIFPSNVSEFLGVKPHSQTLATTASEIITKIQTDGTAAAGADVDATAAVTAIVAAVTAATTTDTSVATAVAALEGAVADQIAATTNPTVISTANAMLASGMTLGFGAGPGFGDILNEYGPSWFNNVSYDRFSVPAHTNPTTKSLYDDNITSFPGTTRDVIGNSTYKSVQGSPAGDLQKGGIWFPRIGTISDYNTAGLYIRTDATILAPTWDSNKVDMMDKNYTENPAGAIQGAGTAYSGRQTLPYIMEISGGNDKVATLTFLQDVVHVKDFATSSSNSLSVEIPLVSIVKEKTDVRVKIDSNLSGITGVTINLASTGNSQTEAVIRNAPVTGRNTLTFSLNIDEKRMLSFKDTALSSRFFTLIAPDDFEFVDPEGRMFYDSYFLPGLVLDVNYGYDREDRREIKNVLVFEATELDRSTQTNTLGSIYLTDLTLKADNDAPWGEVKLELKDGSYDDNFRDSTGHKKLGVTDQTIKGLERVDWQISFKTMNTVPTLVNGRYDRINSGSAKDEDHKAAKISFSENSVHAWWAERQTIFELSPGAKFRKIKIDKSKNFQIRYSTESANDILNNDYSIQSPNNSSNSKYTHNYITLEPTRFTLEEIYIKKDSKAYFELESWVSLESGYEGDVTLTARGSSIPTDSKIEPLIIAKSVNPITLSTTISDVRIGYQGEKTADFSIKETDKARLQKDKTVEIYLDDEIGNDYMYFAHQDNNPIKIEIEGDMKIRDVKLNSGKISFIIDKTSTKASTINVSNVRVKLDRGVPESNLHPYKLVVAGSAVAANAMYDLEGNTNTTKERKFDNFSVKGVKSDYLKVVTSATGRPGMYTSVVKVTVGDAKVLVGENSSLDMDTAAFIDPESQSLMVPVRFISTALGIDEDLIVWNNNTKTVTIYGNKTIQFTIDSDIITVDGVSNQMSTNGYTVKALVKDDRSFLPFRALGNALGISVNWNEETKTATYNDGNA